MINKKTEELQSRRQFFKQATKAAIPVLAIIATAAIPTNMVASPRICDVCTGVCTGCQYGCQDTCRGCDSTCSGTCAGTSR